MGMVYVCIGGVCGGSGRRKGGGVGDARFVLLVAVRDGCCRRTLVLLGFTSSFENLVKKHMCPELRSHNLAAAWHDSLPAPSLSPLLLPLHPFPFPQLSMTRFFFFFSFLHYFC